LCTGRTLNPQEILTRAWEAFNVGDDPAFFDPPMPLAVAYRRAGKNRSLSVADVVVIDGEPWSVERFGWKHRSTDELNLERDDYD
jgi:hypothetical protein